MENEILGGQPAEVNADTAAAHIDDALKVETVHYEDGVSATGVAPLPEHSPDGAPKTPYPIGLDSHFGNDKQDFESLYHAEKLAHDFTKHELAGAKAMIQGAVKMGFKFGVGIHGGA